MDTKNMETKKVVEFSKRFKPCKLVVYYAHGHKTNDYRITDREAEVYEDGTEVSRWRTTRTIPDPENAKKAASLRAKFIKEVCNLGVQYGQEKLVFVDFEREDDLDALKNRWAETVKEFNAGSQVVKINFGTLPPLDLTGSNEYLLGNLLDELKDTMGEMKSALENADYKGVREVIGRLKGFATLVPDKQANLIVDAIADARKQARMMRAQLVKKGRAIEEVQEMISTTTVDIAASACIMDDYFDDQDGPSGADLMEAQAEQFAAAMDDGLDYDRDEDVMVDSGPVVDPVGDTDTPDPSLASTPMGQDFRFDF